VNYGFTPRRIASMREQVQALTDTLLEPADERGRIELVAELCYPLPLQVILAMFGVPLEDAEDIRVWSDEIALAVGSEYADVDRAYDALSAFRTYVTQLIDRRRGVAGRDDLLAALMAAEEGGSKLSTDELVVLFVRLLFAGHETTTNRIANSVVALLRHPDQLQLLRDDPSLIGSALEELLRYRTSVQTLHRVATRDTEIGGVPVLAGQSVRMLLGSAHHDEKVFDEPERLDIRRQNANRSLALGFGIHTCLGAWLQRLETDVALTTLLTRYPRMRLVEVGEPRPNFILTGPRSVQLELR
jgi:cytochrome P450